MKNNKIEDNTVAQEVVGATGQKATTISENPTKIQQETAQELLTPANQPDSIDMADYKPRCPEHPDSQLVKSGPVYGKVPKHKYFCKTGRHWHNMPDENDMKIIKEMDKGKKTTAAART